MAVRIGSLPSEQALGGRSWRGARGRARVKHRKFGRAGQAAVQRAPCHPASSDGMRFQSDRNRFQRLRDRATELGLFGQRKQFALG